MAIGFQRLVLVLAFLAFGGTARADTTIQFENIGGNTGDPITNYGSHAAGTPDIYVSYRTYNASNNSTLFHEASLFATAGVFGDLNAAAYSVQDDAALQIRFTARAGFEGTINHFDLAAIPISDIYTFSFVQIVDRSNQVLWSSNLSPSSTAHTTYTPDLTFTGSVFLQFGNTWNVGIDNINFSQAPVSATSPEPSTLVLGATGLIALGIMRRRWSR
jgi:hypothetical protein